MLYGANGFSYGAKAMVFCAPPALALMLAGHSATDGAGAQVSTCLHDLLYLYCVTDSII